MEKLMYLAPVLGIVALLFAFVLAGKVGKMDEGTDRMKEIAASIREGANAFLKAEYKILVIFAAVLFVLIGFGVSWPTAVCFIIGAIFRTCIGSGTVGMITAATMLLPLMDVLGFTSPMGRVIAMLACASGGAMIWHGNDDFFWVVTATSEMPADVGYKTIPIISILQAVTSLICVYILQMIFL